MAQEEGQAEATPAVRGRGRRRALALERVRGQDDVDGRRAGPGAVAAVDGDVQDGDVYVRRVGRLRQRGRRVVVAVGAALAAVAAVAVADHVVRGRAGDVFIVVVGLGGGAAEPFAADVVGVAARRGAGERAGRAPAQGRRRARRRLDQGGLGNDQRG